MNSPILSTENHDWDPISKPKDQLLAQKFIKKEKKIIKKLLIFTSILLTTQNEIAIIMALLPASLAFSMFIDRRSHILAQSKTEKIIHKKN